MATTISGGSPILNILDRVDYIQADDESEVEYTLDIGDNLVEVEVTWADGNETKLCKVTMTREPAGLILNFLSASPLHLSQMERAGSHMTAGHVYVAANGGGLSSIWMFGRNASRSNPSNHYVLLDTETLDFHPSGLTASSAYLYILSPVRTPHAYDLETQIPDSTGDISFAFHGTNSPATSLRDVYALRAHANAFNGPESGMGLVYLDRRIESGIEQLRTVGLPGVTVHHDDVHELEIDVLAGLDLATDLSTYGFIENGAGDGTHVFDVQPSGTSDLSLVPCYFGRTAYGGLYFDGSLLWTVNVDSYR